MANGIGVAVDEAARLDEIGFPEFTTKLVTDVFDALIASNVRQMESYTELLAAVSKELTTYINETQDEIDGEQILAFLAQVLPAADDDGDEATKVHVGGELTSGDSESLSEAVAVPGEDAPDLPSGTLDQSGVDEILGAVARRIAANRYELLTQLVRQGLLRLVVDTGTIETRLTFSTYATSTSQRQARTYDRRSRVNKAGVGVSLPGKLLSFGASASTQSTRLRVRTTSQQDRDISGSRVQIYGGVTLNFRTDFLPLET
jgi:hypothetical protein